MALRSNYVEKLANNIEQKLNMSASEIKQLSNSEFRNLLRNGYFSEKRYTHKAREPTDRQMDVLNLHYGKPVYAKKAHLYNTNKKYYHYKITERGKRKYYPKYVRKNKSGRLIDAKTGRFISTNK